MEGEDSSARGENMAGYCFGKINILRFDLKESGEGFFLERKGRVVPCRGADKTKGMRTNSGKSGTINPDSENIRR